MKFLLQATPQVHRLMKTLTRCKVRLTTPKLATYYSSWKLFLTAQQRGEVECLANRLHDGVDQGRSSVIQDLHEWGTCVNRWVNILPIPFISFLILIIIFISDKFFQMPLDEAYLAYDCIKDFITDTESLNGTLSHPSKSLPFNPPPKTPQITK